MQRIREIQKIDPKQYKTGRITEEKVLHFFDLCDAFWMHDGDPRKPHAELTSGLCSNGYFNCPEVLKHPNLCQILAHWLYRKLTYKGIKEVDWVIGSPDAAITLSYEIAKAFGAIHGFTEKDLFPLIDPVDPKGKRMVWRRMTIPREAVVLQIDEMISTGRTLREVRRAVVEGNAEPVRFLPVVGTLVHRPPRLPVDYDGIEVISLVEKVIWAIKPEECPLCKAGSPRYHPKTHWKELTGKA